MTFLLTDTFVSVKKSSLEVTGFAFSNNSVTHVQLFIGTVQSKLSWWELEVQ